LLAVFEALEALDQDAARYLMCCLVRGHRWCMAPHVTDEPRVESVRVPAKLCDRACDTAK
jgi:hypothetical protein